MLKIEFVGFGCVCDVRLILREKESNARVNRAVHTIVFSVIGSLVAGVLLLDGSAYERTHYLLVES